MSNKKASGWGNADPSWNNEVKRTFRAKKCSPEAASYTPFMKADFRRLMHMLQDIYNNSDMGEINSSLIAQYNKAIGEHFSNPEIVTKLGLVSRKVAVKEVQASIINKHVHDLMYGNENSPDVYVAEETKAITELVEPELDVEEDLIVFEPDGTE